MHAAERQTAAVLRAKHGPWSSSRTERAQGEDPVWVRGWAGERLLQSLQSLLCPSGQETG